MSGLIVVPGVVIGMLMDIEPCACFYGVRLASCGLFAEDIAIAHFFAVAVDIAWALPPVCAAAV